MITYLGQGKTAFHEQPGCRWSKSPEGLDIYDTVWAGPKNVKDVYERLFVHGSQTLAGHQSMYLVAVDYEEGRSFGAFQLRWVGLKRGGRMPDPFIVRRISIKTSGSSTDSPEAATRDLSYWSPELVFNYATTEETLEPQQDGSGVEVPTYALRVIRDVIETDEGRIYRGSAPAGLVSALTLAPVWRVAGLNSAQIEYTPFWSNEEVWAYEYPEG